MAEQAGRGTAATVQAECQEALMALIARVDALQRSIEDLGAHGARRVCVKRRR